MALAEAPRFAGLILSEEDVEIKAMEARARVMAEIERLGLGDNVRELEIDGYTVVPPEKAAPPGFTDRLRDAVLAHNGKGVTNAVDIRPDKVNTDSGPYGQAQWTTALLHRDPIFEQVLMSEVGLALATYLLGESFVLMNYLSIVKGPGTEYLALHADQNQLSSPPPFPAFAQIANVTWVLTDYNEENGATCFVPGSHRFCRPPSPREATDLSTFKPVEVKAGSLLVIHGNTWHGAVPRRASGFRVSLVEALCRWYHRVDQDYVTGLPPEAYGRNPPRFATLIGAKPVAFSEQWKVANYSQFG